MEKLVSFVVNKDTPVSTTQNGYINMIVKFLILGGYVADIYSNYTASLPTDESLLNFMCINGSLSECTYGAVNSCSSYGGDVVIACYTGQQLVRMACMLHMVFCCFHVSVYITH